MPSRLPLGFAEMIEKKQHRAMMKGMGVSGQELQMVAILGCSQENRIATSIIEALYHSQIEVHQIIPRRSLTTNYYVASHISDFTESSLTDVLSNLKPDLVISTFASGSYDTQKRFVDCAVKAGVPRFVAPEFGQDTQNPGIHERLPPAKERGRFIDYLRKLSGEGCIDWTAVASGYLLDYGLESGNLGFNIKWQSATMHGPGNEKFAASSVRWIGQVMLGVIIHWNEVCDQYIYACGMVTTANEILATLQRCTGQTWEVGRATDDEDCIREAERRIERGFLDAGMFLMERSVLYDVTLDAVRPFIEKDAKKALGLEGEDLEDVVKKALYGYTHRDNECDCGN
ncbi:MAG: hypothetical protein FE78DRAFT_67826 [Acidomyces sp. 'richmondensis']|nr:MAG: hypothetical protein FE78DRAFT_67826 [Acidomyces sp. 'richmondensis']